MTVSQVQSFRASASLVAEDDAILAFDLETLLRDAGAVVLGPAATVAHTLALAGAEPLSCALLDVNLRGGTVFPAAQMLRYRGIRMIFHTGCAEWETLKDEWPEAEVLTKPSYPKLLLQAVCDVCRPYRSACGLVGPV